MTHMEQRSLDHFSELLDLLFAASNIAVGHIRLLLYLYVCRTLLFAQWLLDNVNDTKQSVLFRTCIIVTVGSILGGKGIWI